MACTPAVSGFERQDEILAQPGELPELASVSAVPSRHDVGIPGLVSGQRTMSLDDDG